MDSDYLKDTIGKSLSEGLAHLAKCRTHDAVEYLGYYLINFVEKANNAIKVSDFREEHVHKTTEFNLEQQEMEIVKQEIDEIQKRNVEILESVREELRVATEVTPGLMHRIIDTLMIYTNAANVYFGRKLPAAAVPDENEEGDAGEPQEEEEEDEKEEKEEKGDGEEEEDPSKSFPPSEEVDIIDSDTDPIPIDDSRAKIEYLYTSQNNDFMLDCLLMENEGVTWDLWKKKEGEEEEEEEQEEEEEGVEKKPKPEKPPPELFVPEVLLNDRIKYFDIPKLGSYFAVPFTFNSSIHPHAFDDLFKPKKPEGEEEEEEEKQDDEDEDDDDKPKAPVSDEPPPPPEAKPLPIDMLVCLDTMGLDKQFTEDQRLEVHTWTPLLKDIYERIEKRDFLLEVDKYMALKEQNIKDLEEVSAINKSSEKEIKAQMKELRKQKKIPAEEKAENEMKMRYDIALSNLTSNFRSRITLFGDFRIQPSQTITTILVNCLYLLGYNNGQIMETRRPHVLDWQKVRLFLNEDLMTTIEQYDPLIIHTTTPYTTVKIIKKNIKKVNLETLVDENVFIFYLATWMLSCIECRIAATNHRKRNELERRMQAYEEEKEAERLRKEQEEEERERYLAEHPELEEENEEEKEEKEDDDDE